LLRRFAVDELPQLVNVICGDMSLVGPRPLEIHVAAALDARALDDRCRVRPGLTGLWQVSGRSDLTIQQMIELDREYVRAQSWTLDLQILFRTPGQILSGRGAY
jgi:lipopolysaccharide/colanic/teichoic acid biosynthesis glycosyltransferase